MNNLSKSLKLHWLDLLNFLSLDYGDRDYTKFVILGRSRVGSNMLRSILNNSSEVISYGELFRTMGKVGWDMPYYRSNDLNFLKEGEYLQSQPIEFLERRIFKKYPRNVQAVGFKLFYYHARQKEWQKVWDYLQSTHVKIIHLKRRDLLRVYVSRQLAGETGGWKDKKYNSSVTLDPPSCENDFRRTHKWWQETTAFFYGNPMLELWYEDLIEDRQLWVNKILDFLEIQNSSINFDPSTKKQSKKKTSELINNFDELKKYFSNTKWEYLFNSSN